MRWKRRFCLSVAPRRNSSVSLRACRRRRTTVILSLSVGLLAGDGPLSLRLPSVRLCLSAAPRQNGSVSLRGCRRRRKTVILSLSVGLLDGDGPLSLCVSPRFVVFDTVSRSICLLCSIKCGCWLIFCFCVCVARWMDQKRFHLVCRKRDEDGSANKGLQLQFRLVFLCHLVWNEKTWVELLV